MKEERNVLILSESFFNVFPDGYFESGETCGIAVPLNFQRISAADIPADCISAINGVSLVKVIGNILGREIPCNCGYKVQRGDTLYVVRHRGQLPDVTIEFIRVNAIGIYGDGAYEFIEPVSL